MSRRKINVTDFEVNTEEKLVETYNKLKEEENRIKKEVKNLNDDIKKYMVTNKKDTLVFGNVTLNYSVTDKTAMNDDLAIEILRDELSEELFNKVVYKKECIDDEALMNEINKGSIDAHILLPCITTKQVETLRLGKVK